MSLISTICCFVLIPVALFGAVAASRKDDAIITELPGLMFDPGFKQYSGYLNAGNDSVANFKFFYWFTEAQESAETAPLVLWLNGGPGCSSVGGFLLELGPFYANRDGTSLYENPYSWNKIANVLFLESPHHVGFSYSTDFDPVGGASWTNSDTQVAEQNYKALLDFFTVFPEYVGREFFITGESYGGVYLPTLGRRILRGIAQGEFPNNLTGIAIGNGCMDRPLLENAIIDFNYYHGFIGTEVWSQIKDVCCNHSASSPTQCNYVDHLQLVDNHIYVSDGSLCGNLSIQASEDLKHMADFDQYNIYQDCYQERFHIKQLLAPTRPQKMDGARNTYYDSTDPYLGYPCFSGAATFRYLNRADVQMALHIAPDWKNHSLVWHECTGKKLNYTREFPSVANFFRDIFQAEPSPRLLIYNGDVDTVCNYLADSWFADAVAHTNGYALDTEYHPWFHRGQIAGFAKSFVNNRDNSIDFLTVKGSGHFVPLDRPGPALQMMANFFAATRNYSQADGVDTSLKPPLPTTPPPLDRKQQDKIHSLPGISFQLNFDQYSGYLDGGKNESSGAAYRMHYWLVESQHSNKDPLVLWLNGGPGCSSLGGFFDELGPFYPNKGGDSLYENVFAWNKVANVLFLETPHGVGFSYATDWAMQTNDDDAAAMENLNALKDFFSVFPEYKDREFYIAGESYAGMFIPWLTVKILDGIENGSFPSTNFKGIAIGNGFLSEALTINSIVNYNYYHGLVGNQLWNDVQRHCCKGVHPDDCDYFSHLRSQGPSRGENDYKSDGTACGNATMEASYNLMWKMINDPYNLYQSCYARKSLLFFERMFPTLMQYVDTAKLLNRDSTDALNGLPCWGDESTTHYLDKAAVQQALHIHSDWQAHYASKWIECKYEIFYTFETLLSDMGPKFDEILRPRRNVEPIRILIYNGDADMVCNFLGDAWFVERIVANHSIPLNGRRKLWRYRGQVAGYAQSYGNHGDTTIDVLTVNGAGHFVPLDRAGPALQMIANFMWNTTDYSRPTGVDEHPKPLIEPRQQCPTTPPPTPRAATSITTTAVGALFFALLALIVSHF